MSTSFALDFAYDEWATLYREQLHASYLETVERADYKGHRLGSS